MTKKFIFIPVVNNFHLLEKAINSVKPGLFDKYFIFNNSSGPIPIDTKHFEVIDKYGRLTFRDTQNVMREYAIENKYDYFCFMHNDGEILDDTAERLILKGDELIKNNNKWGVIFTHYDVFCAYSTKCVETISTWGDDLWPKDQQSGYFLDCDYYRRMKLTGHEIISLENTNVLHNEPSNTIKDEKELVYWIQQSERIKTHYINKWGGDVGYETFEKPFNVWAL
jgi:hypothetical protein